MHTHRERRRPAGFTVIELMMALAIVAIAFVLLAASLFMWSEARYYRTLPQHHNNTQLRGIHQAMVTYAQSNKKGGNDGFFPGLDRYGNVIPDGPLTGHSGDGTVPAAAMWMLLEGNFFTPEYMINPGDGHAVELALDPATGTYPPVTHENFSYAFQSLVGHPAEKSEWKETLNTATIVMSDRAIGTGHADISSVWTAPGSGDWRGGVVRNDNSTGFETNPVLTDTQYGDQPVNPTDNLFEDDPTTADAFLVHEDATTGYSKD